MRKNMHLILAFVLAIAAGLAVWLFMSLNAPSVKVVTVKNRLTIGAILTQKDLQTKLLPKSALPPDVVTNQATAIGKTLNYSVLPGEILRQEHITAGHGSLVARLASVAPGKIAVDLPPEAAKGLLGLEIGNVVDIYGTVGVPTGDGQAATAIKKVAANATILYAPNGNDGAIIVACTPQEEAQMADVLTGGKQLALFLHPDQGGR